MYSESGKAGHMGKDGSMSVKERSAMPEAALVNTGAARWADVASANRAIRGMQIKLHRGGRLPKSGVTIG